MRDEQKYNGMRTEDLEPITIFITSTKITGPDEEDTKNAVDTLLADFRLIRTPNPLVWFFLGRWRPEITEEVIDRIDSLVDSLKTVDGNAMVTVSYSWTNVMQYQQLAWKAWREIIS